MPSPWVAIVIAAASAIFTGINMTYTLMKGRRERLANDANLRIVAQTWTGTARSGPHMTETVRITAEAISTSATPVTITEVGTTRADIVSLLHYSNSVASGNALPYTISPYGVMRWEVKQEQLDDIRESELYDDETAVAPESSELPLKVYVKGYTRSGSTVYWESSALPVV